MVRVDSARLVLTRVLASVALASACAGRAAPAAKGPPAVEADAKAAPEPRTGALRYTFAIAQDLESIDGTVCFEGKVPPELVPGVRARAELLRRPVSLEPSGARELPVRDGRVQLAGLEPGACVRYTIAFDPQPGAWPGFEVLRRGPALMTNTALWLWRPAHFEAYSEATARFELPVELQLSVPWERRDELFVLDTSAFAFHSYAVFGRFGVEQIETAGVRMEVAVLEGLTPETRAFVRPWLERAVHTTTLATGRFPRERAQTVVVPLASTGEAVPSGVPTGEAVPFGMMTRGGGASAAFLVASDAELADLQESWVPVHEFAHLFVPFVARGDLWLSEGLATYYQEVLRVRAEIVTPSEAWRSFHEGALRGRGVPKSLAVDCAAVFDSREFSRVYWAGAALALMADVELRRRSRGTQTLDALLRRLGAGVQARPLPAREVLERLDRAAGAPIFQELSERWVYGPSFPDLGPTYERLGIAVAPDDSVTFGAGPDAWIRDAIMR